MQDTGADHQTSLIGNLDSVTKDGIVEGWCWDPEHPDIRQRVIIEADGQPVGEALAGLFRADLKEAGIGDGSHHFRHILPLAILGQKRSVEIRARDAGTGRYVGASLHLSQPEAATIDDRLAELEGEVRLLTSRVAELTTASAVDGGKDTDVLFETIGAFFLDLARGAESSVQRPARELNALVQRLMTNYGTLTLPVVAQPVATVFVEAGAPLPILYACIASLHALGNIDVYLLDSGEYDDASLLPIVVRNLHYVRLHQIAPAERNRFVKSVETEFVIFLGGFAKVADGWLSAIVETFQLHPEAAVVGSQIRRSDGIVHHVGLKIDGDGQLRDFGVGRLADDPDCSGLCEVDGLGDFAVAFRRSEFIEAGGFAFGLDAAVAAVLDLCRKLQDRGRLVLYQPSAVVHWHDDGLDSPRWQIAPALVAGSE